MPTLCLAECGANVLLEGALGHGDWVGGFVDFGSGGYLS